MKPVDQTTFGFPGGNCFSAAVASILEFPLRGVPYFMGESRDEPGDAWWRRFHQWLEPRGLWAICLPWSDEWLPDGYHILSGKSPRSTEDAPLDHSVVAFRDEIVHDPHPSRDGLLSRKDTIILVPLDPAVGLRAEVV